MNTSHASRIGRRIEERKFRPAICLVILPMLAAVGMTASATLAVPIFGGLGYDSTNATGYSSPIQTSGPVAFIGNGSLVGTANKTVNGNSLGTRGVRWDSLGNATELGTLSTISNGSSYSSVSATNPSGTAVGTSRMFSGFTSLGDRAVRWNAGTSVAIELDHLGTKSDGYTQSNARAINAAGTAVGMAEDYINDRKLGTRAVRWDSTGTAVTVLGDLGTDPLSGFTNADAFAINDAGAAVGYARKYTGQTNLGSRAVRWDAGGTAATELGLAGFYSAGSSYSSQAIAINSGGMSCGFAIKYVGDVNVNGISLGERPIRWDASGNATELETLAVHSTGFTDCRATAINSAGTTIGISHKYNGSTSLGRRAVRWDANGTTVTELGNLGTAGTGFTLSSAFGINAGGVAVGYANQYIEGVSNGSRAVAWGLDGTAIDLNTLLSPADAAVWTLQSASSISDGYWVAGLGTCDPDGLAGQQAPYGRLFLMDVIRAFGTAGDANRDGNVNFDDLLILSQNYDQSADARWDTGDFDGDGTVGFSDLLSLAQHYQGSPGLAEASLTPDFAADWAMARSLAPEPGLACMLATSALLLPARRSRSSRPTTPAREN